MGLFDNLDQLAQPGLSPLQSMLLGGVNAVAPYANTTATPTSPWAALGAAAGGMGQGIQDQRAQALKQMLGAAQVQHLGAETTGQNLANKLSQFDVNAYSRLQDDGQAGGNAGNVQAALSTGAGARTTSPLLTPPPGTAAPVPQVTSSALGPGGMPEGEGGAPTAAPNPSLARANKADQHPFAGQVAQEAERQGVSPTLATRVAALETGGHKDPANAIGPDNPSGENATGIMQVLPSTGAEINENADLTKAKDNISVGVGYLGKMVNKYGGNEQLAAAAYNWGPGNVDKALKGEIKVPLSVQQYAEAATGRPWGAQAAGPATPGGAAGAAGGPPVLAATQPPGTAPAGAPAAVPVAAPGASVPAQAPVPPQVAPPAVAAAPGSSPLLNIPALVRRAQILSTSPKGAAVAQGILGEVLKNAGPGFQYNGDGSLAYTPGGPADPNYLRTSEGSKTLGQKEAGLPFEIAQKAYEQFGANWYKHLDDVTLRPGQEVHRPPLIAAPGMPPIGGVQPGQPVMPGQTFYNSEERSAQDTARGKRNDEIAAQVPQIWQRIERYKQMQVSAQGADFGAGSGALGGIKKFLAPVLGNIDSLNEDQVFDKLSTQLAVDMTGSLGKGEAATVFNTIRENLPNRQLTKPAVQELLGVGRGAQEFAYAEAKARADYADMPEHGGSTKGFETSGWYEKNSMMQYVMPHLSTEMVLKIAKSGVK